MDCVEEAQAVRAKGYSRPLHYTTDRSLADRNWPFRYVFDHGELRCSQATRRRDRTCYVARDMETTLAREHPSFVYLDVGCWADDADGEGTRRRDFGLVCGPHVYLCEFVPAVQDFFAGLASLGCGARVVAYARARDFERKTWQDPNLYLLLGDLHLPPVTWFYSQQDLISPPPRELPEWLERAPVMARQPDRLLRSAYECAAYHRAMGDVPTARGPFGDNPDISGHAGGELTRFLRALASLDPLVRKRLHFIQLGDLFELWVGRSYQLSPGPDGMPDWRRPQSLNGVATWGLEVMIQNSPVFSALKRLESAGLAEVKYLAGNHDGYLMKEDLAAQLGMPQREPSYRGLNGDLFVEHGHRFDTANFDNVNGRSVQSGPFVTRLLLLKPSLRDLEGPLGKLTILATPAQRDVHLLGATLQFLDERFEQGKKPFSIYAMGHTHARMLARFDIRTKYATTDHEEDYGHEVMP